MLSALCSVALNQRDTVASSQTREKNGTEFSILMLDSRIGIQMHIALLNRDEISHVGGDAVQLRGYQKALRRLGHDADYLSAGSHDLRRYHEAWLFHVNFPWCSCHYRTARTWDLPIRLFPIYYPKSHGMPAETMVFLYAKAIYPLSEVEKLEMLTELDLPLSVASKMRVIPNGVDRNIFFDRGVERKYVMSAGRYETYKGHYRVAQAASALGLPFLIVGAVWDHELHDQCRALCGPDSLVLDNVTQDELAVLYSQARVYVCASTSERNNLAILEAAACGATVINSSENRGNAWLSAPTVDPTNQAELKAAIQRAWGNPISYSTEVKSWDDVVREILA
jgi:glycosyltransferase involved in cell wall biosynthesis